MAHDLGDVAPKGHCLLYSSTAISSGGHAWQRLSNHVGIGPALCRPAEPLTPAQYVAAMAPYTEAERTLAEQQGER